MRQHAVQLVYDQDCPVCSAWCRSLQARAALPGLQLVNAREDTPVLREITRRGMDVDEGMVLEADGELYYGAEAMQALAARTRAAGAFNGINRWLFGSRRGSRILYPVLRAGRNLLLKILGRKRINNLQLPGNERF